MSCCGLGATTGWMAAAPNATAPENATVTERYPRNICAVAIRWRISEICVNASCNSIAHHPATEKPRITTLHDKVSSTERSVNDEMKIWKMASGGDRGGVGGGFG